MGSGNTCLGSLGLGFRNLCFGFKDEIFRGNLNPCALPYFTLQNCKTENPEEASPGSLRAKLGRLELFKSKGPD